MVIVFNIVISILAGLAFLLALRFLLRALRKRTTSHSPFTYGVARQETRHAMQSDLLRATVSLIVGLMLVGVFLALPADLAVTTAVETPTPTPDLTQEEPGDPPGQPLPVNTSTATPTVTLEAAVVETPTVPITPTATPEPTETPTPEPRLAVVDSPNGLWLRAEPGAEGEQIENLAHLSVLTVLDGFTEVDEVEWQEVLSPSGNRGWVAADFLAYQD